MVYNMCYTENPNVDYIYLIKTKKLAQFELFSIKSAQSALLLRSSKIVLYIRVCFYLKYIFVIMKTNKNIEMKTNKCSVYVYGI